MHCDVDRYGVEVFGALLASPVDSCGFQSASSRTHRPSSLSFQSCSDPARKEASAVPVSLQCGPGIGVGSCAGFFH